MDNFEAMSDWELQQRLVQFGFPKQPVTKTTRNVLIKKLKNHVNAQGSKSLRESSSKRKETISNMNSMDNLEYLSDSELRNRLSQYGLPNVPVTSSTRKTLIKKLRNQMDNEKSKLRRETSNATRYSSGEDSDVDSHRSPATNFYGSTSTASHISKYNSNIMPPPATTIVSRRTSSIISPANRTTSDNYRPPERTTRSLISVPPLIYSNETDEDSDYMNSNHRDSYNSILSNRSRYSSSPSYSYVGNNTTNDSSIRSRYSTSVVDGGNSPIINGHSGDESSYSSDFTRRLLNLRGESIRQTGYKPPSPPIIRSRYSTTSHNSFISPNPADIVHQQPEPAGELNISPRVAFQNFIQKLNKQYVFKQSFIPCILLSALLVFLVVVTFMYMTISPDLVNTISEKNTIYTLCPDDQFTTSALTTNDYNCIKRDCVRNAIESLKIIAPELQRRAVHHKCVDNSETFAMNSLEVLRLLVNNDGNIKIREVLPNIEYLIANNPQWKIYNLDGNGNPLTIDDIGRLRDKNESPQYAILNPQLPFTCSLYNKFQKFFFFVGGIAVISFAVGVVYFIYKFIVNYRQSRREIVNNLIDDILNSLMKNAAYNSGSNAVVVNHLRDKLIPLQKRKKLEWAWNEAIRHLEQNESRIQFEVGVLNGEDFKLMKWIDSVGIEQNENSSPVKKWQSPAFDKSSKLISPPTPCLKIGQMFEKYEANNPKLKTVIQDAILEKVGNQCKIYDIQLDPSNGSVYVRCASEHDAGIVYDEINGWWFDSHLVSIKFVRLERYLSRFPKSSSGPKCLRPSNSKNLSMSQCYKGAAYNRFEDDDDDDDDSENNDAQKRN